MNKVLVAERILDPQYDSDTRREAFGRLGRLVEIERYDQEDMTAEDAENVVGVIANSVLFTRSFYEAANDLRIIARWGVGFDKVNVEIATELGVVICVAPVHMSTVAEYAVAQWLATLKRVYTLNRMSHNGEFGLVKTYEAEGSTLGIYGLGRIGLHLARRARPLLGKSGRLLVYDVRPDIIERAAEVNAEVVERSNEIVRGMRYRVSARLRRRHDRELRTPLRHEAPRFAHQSVSGQPRGRQCGQPGDRGRTPFLLCGRRSCKRAAGDSPGTSANHLHQPQCGSHHPIRRPPRIDERRAGRERDSRSATVLYP